MSYEGGEKVKNMTDFPTITDERLIKVLKDPEQFASVITSLSKLENLEDEIEKHGLETLVRLACETTEEIYSKERG